MKNHLRALRQERGWSQGALADRLGVSRQTVNALETGRYDPSLPLAFTIARLFSRRIEDVFVPDTGEGPDPAAVGAPDDAGGAADGAAHSPRARTPA